MRVKQNFYWIWIVDRSLVEWAPGPLACGHTLRWAGWAVHEWSCYDPTLTASQSQLGGSRTVSRCHQVLVWDMACIAGRDVFFVCMRLANERRHYNVTSSLIGWAHAENYPCIVAGWLADPDIGLGISLPVMHYRPTLLWPLVKHF